VLAVGILAVAHIGTVALWYVFDGDGVDVAGGAEDGEGAREVFDGLAFDEEEALRACTLDTGDVVLYGQDDKEWCT
jgi:hypothetical protein